MFPREQYQLMDFGDQQKLERFGTTLVRRPCLVANAGLKKPEAWPAVLTYVEIATKRDATKRGEWKNSNLIPDPWQITWRDNRFQLRPTPFGHLGVFPEQQTNWQWITELPFNLDGLSAINLFAYTGGTTMALANAGARVTHVDSARNIVNWARENARLSGLAEAPIRWIVEDVAKFVRRELRRGRKYDVVVLDPPSYGRGPKNETWKIQQDLEPLMNLLAELTTGKLKAIIVSSHTPDFGMARLKELTARSFGPDLKRAEAFKMSLGKVGQHELTVGDCIRWHSPD